MELKYRIINLELLNKTHADETGSALRTENKFRNLTNACLTCFVFTLWTE